MPHIIVKIAEGRSQSSKKQLSDRLAQTMSDVLGLDLGSVSVAVEDVPMQEWMQRVYGPDIEAAGDRLLKRPGYGPLASPPEK